MAAPDGFEKGDRIIRLIHLLRMFQAAPAGLTTSQVADRLGVSQRSVQRDVTALEFELQVPFYRSKGRWLVREEYWLRPKGKYLVAVCRSLTCELCGAENVTERLKRLIQRCMHAASWQELLETP